MAEKKIPVTPEQLADIAKRRPEDVALGRLKVEGTVVVRDKDGNIKSTMRVTNEVDDNATE